MASISKYVAYNISFKFNATAGTVTRTSATQYTVKIDASWSTYWSGNATYCGVTVSSGNNSVVLNPNQTKASSGSGSFTGTYSISGNSAATKSVVVTFTIYDPTTGSTAYKTTTITLSVSVPAWTSYTIKYNANGGSGAPSSQTKWKDQTLTLSSTKPTRTGYTFLGWSTSSSATSATYSAGGKYTTNAAATLYAVWKIVTYTIKFNANGGSGAPSSQTKSYGVTLTLSTTKPTRTNYNFLGWATSSTATSAKYSAGGSYTANTATTLYAVWELAYTPPRITNVSVSRCDLNGTVDEEGQCGLISYEWACDETCTDVTYYYKTSSSSEWTTCNIDFPGDTGNTSGTETGFVIGGDRLNNEVTYDIKITVRDLNGSSSTIVTLPSSKFAIDVKSGGTGIAFGKVAEIDNVADFGYQAKFSKGILQPTLTIDTDLNTVLTPNTYAGTPIESSSYTNLPGALASSYGTFTLEVKTSGEEGQIIQILTNCSKTKSVIWKRCYYGSAWGDWYRVAGFEEPILWSGVKYMTSSHSATLSETVSSQPTGICLVFSRYEDGEALDYGWTTYFVPKKLVSLYSGKAHIITMSTTNAEMFATKYLYIYDDRIDGYDRNSASGTTSTGITYDNKLFVLRYVIGC